MASCGYHSPQFSEDVAWLPAWLQPHHLPPFGDDRKKDGEAISQSSSQNLASSGKNICHGQDAILFRNHDAKYSGHLYLSGEDNSVAGNSPSSASALHFNLHLSSADASQISPSKISESGYPQIEISQSGKFERRVSQSGRIEKIESSFKKPVHGTSAVQGGATCQYIVNDGAPASTLPVRRESKMSCKRIFESQNRAEQTKRKKLRGKIDTETLSNAIELSIAASEATAISEIVSSSLQSEQLSAAAILEIALRVKQARNEPSDVLEAVPSLSADEFDETDQLSDLDETMMADAFSDVGILCTQNDGTATNSDSGGKSLHSNSFCDVSSDSHHQVEEPGKKIQAGDANANEATSKVYAMFAIESISNSQPLKPLPVQLMKPSACVPLYCSNSCLRSTSKADAQKLHCRVDALSAIKIGAIDHGIHELENDKVPPEVANITGSSRPFKWETSFISESTDMVEESTSEHGPEAEPETVASSGTPYGETTRCLHEESERRSSSSLSLVDPLCSFVPCSISSNNTHSLCGYNQKDIEKENEILTSSAGITVLLELDETSELKKAQDMPLKLIVQGGNSIFSAGGSIDPGMPSRKHFSSLKPYSMVMPDPCASGKIAFGQIPSHKISKSMQFSPSERNSNINYFVSCEGVADVPSKPMTICVDSSGLDNNHSRGINNHVAERPDNVEENDDIGALISHYEKRNSPITLNNKKSRVRACKVISLEEILKRSSAPKRRKYRARNSMNGARCRDQAYPKSCIPLHLYPADKQKLKKKSVRFAEAKTSTDMTQSRVNQQPKYQVHGLLHATDKRQKQSSSGYKHVLKEENYNYLTCSQTVDEKGMILQGLEFLLTGFSSQKEKELEALIRLYGGYVLPNIPSGYPGLEAYQRKKLPRRNLPMVISPKKVQTTKYLYGCATNTWMLNAHWLIDSIQAGSILPPGKYMTRPIQGSERNQLRIEQPLYLNSHTFIFEKAGIMIHGKPSFCTKFSKIVKHGGGQVFKSLQRLVQSLTNGTNTLGTVIVENESNVSRHLKYCALENNLQTMPASWIVNSLFTGKLLPFKKDRTAALHRIKMPTFPLAQEDSGMSEEI